MALQIHETAAKSIIGSTKVPSADYVINPYTGCQFACMYCFASFMGRFVGESNGNWGNYVYVKTNAVELMEKQIHRLLKKDPHPRIAISTVTDPYQGVERKHRLTRGILKVFAEHDYQGRVSILTKSPTVLDDLEALKRIKYAEVGLSITTSDDKLSRQLDAMAPLTHARLETLRKLTDAGVKSYVFVGPFLPHMYLRPELIDELFAGIRATGATEVKVEYLNLPSYVRPRLREFLKDQPADIQAVYAKSQNFEYRDTLEPMIREALANNGLQLRFNEIVHHVSDQDLKETL
ncbi:spore photoproduct lyase family protein [Ruegeria sp. HKCCD6119]|uniref:SPL family radical SAM protein n=1 Tax=Ruegeria sp. HKCCD6119 TaxID=2683003 RepID=UPI00149124FE|nr:radical SAM protein [Ruegeria sp. HKCCD6119]NOD85565.1 radical SAM protein [Ruegeria sp. HKCCD6119]